MKVVKLSKNKWRKYGVMDWVRENVYYIPCVMLITVIIYMTVEIIRAF